jgi:hypothetical protein
MFLIALLSLASMAVAQTEAHEHGAAAAASQGKPEAAKPAPKTPAQLSFDELKSLAGEWEGKVTLNPPMKGMGETELHVTMRVTSRGNSLTHEFQEAGKPFDATKYDHPVTMVYVDEGQLNLVHYCDAGNRPHMVAKPSPEGKSIAFNMTDITGPVNRGHMQSSVFTPIDENHHVEEWTYMLPGDKPMVARMDLHRVPTTTAAK